jgi:hypothetical protein
MENLRSAVGAVVRKGKEFAGAAGDLLRRSVMPWLRDALGKVRAFSPDGKALIYAGGGGIATGIALILLTTPISQPPASKLIITGRAVNIRATPSTTAKAVAKTERGEMVSLLSSAEGWYQVRTQAGATGWIWEKLAERKKNTSEAVRYGMTGSGLVIIVGLALLIVGIVRRLRASSAAPRASREAR